MATLASHSSQTNSESCLEVPSCRQLLTLLVSETAQHSADFECPSLRQLRALLPAGPPLLFLNISCNIFFKDTIQSSAIILIDNHFSPSLIILSTLVSIFPSKLPFSAIVSLSPISSFASWTPCFLDSLHPELLASWPTPGHLLNSWPTPGRLLTSSWPPSGLLISS